MELVVEIKETQHNKSSEKHNSRNLMFEVFNVKFTRRTCPRVSFEHLFNEVKPTMIFFLFKQKENKKTKTTTLLLLLLCSHANIYLTYLQVCFCILSCNWHTSIWNCVHCRHVLECHTFDKTIVILSSTYLLTLS